MPDSLVAKRIEDVASFYDSPSLATAIAFLRRYQVQYIIVGGLERRYYQAAGIEKFQQMADQGLLQDVFSAGSGLDRLTIYRVPK